MIRRNWGVQLYLPESSSHDEIVSTFRLRRNAEKLCDRLNEDAIWVGYRHRYRVVRIEGGK